MKSAIESPALFLGAVGQEIGKIGERTGANWPLNLGALPPVVAYGQLTGGDGIILALFYILFTLDLVLGVAAAIRAGGFREVKFEKWLIKFFTYTLCIGVVAAVNDALQRSLWAVLPILDLLLSVLLTGEALSIFKNLDRLGCPVPPVLLRLTGRLKERAEKKLEGIMDEERAETR